MSLAGLFLGPSGGMGTGAGSMGLGYASPSPPGAAAMCRCGPFFSGMNKPLGRQHGVPEMRGHCEKRSGLVQEKSCQGRVLWQTLAAPYWC